MEMPAVEREVGAEVEVGVEEVEVTLPVEVEEVEMIGVRLLLSYLLFFDTTVHGT